MWRSLRAMGADIISTWIDFNTNPDEIPSNLAQLCVTEAAEADVLVLYCQPEEVLKGVLIEVGAALAQGKEVRCIGDSPSINPMWRKHRLWSTYPSIESALVAPIITAKPADPVMDELVTYLEIAHVALNRFNDGLGQHLDLSDEELQRLRVNLQDHLNK